MHARLLGTKSLLTLYEIIDNPDFPYLADKIAEPHPDMNIKVAAFTVSEKSSNTNSYHSTSYLVLHVHVTFQSRILIYAGSNI